MPSSLILHHIPAVAAGLSWQGHMTLQKFLIILFNITLYCNIIIISIERSIMIVEE
jgi:hypothetical protein